MESQSFETTQLPALIDRARQRLAEARSSAEVLEAKAVAEAALHYARLTKAANETHADCLRMIVRAEVRMADEIDAGQARGEIQKVGGDRKSIIAQSSGNDPTPLDALGLDSRRIAEWRDVRDVGEAVVEQAIQHALEDGRAPTKADVKRAVDGKPHVSLNSGNNEWYTPSDFIEAARSAMGSIDLDPASSKAANKFVAAKAFYTVTDDGLSKRWSGNVWMNPPYAQPLVSQFAQAVSDKFDSKEIKRACVLVNNATETSWFQRMLDSAAAVCFLSTRVKFIDPSGDPTGAPLQGQAVLYLGDNPYRFAKSFSELGHVLFKAP